MHVDVLVVGSLNLDLVVRSARHPAPGETLLGSEYSEFAGGKGLNQAVAAARCGASVGLVGAVGDDEAGHRLRSIAEAEGVDTTWVRTVADAPTGRALITVSDSGENSIIVVAGANATATWPNDPPTGSVVLAQLEVPLATVTAAFLAASTGTRTVLNPAPATPLPSDLLRASNIVIPNEHELHLIGGTEQLLQSADTVITTLGELGAEIATTGASPSRVPSLAVEVIDTTGAGDAFCGNFAARLSAGDDQLSAARFAAAAGALATTVAGAVPSLPHHTDVAARLA